MDDEKKVININVKGGKVEKIDERLLAIQIISYKNPVLEELHDLVFSDPPLNFAVKKPSIKHVRHEELSLKITKKPRTKEIYLASNEEHKVKFLFLFF